MKNSLKAIGIIALVLIVGVGLLLIVQNESSAQLPSFLRLYKGPDKASAATLNFGNGGGYFQITGTAKPDSIVPAPAGTLLVLGHASTDTVVDGKNLKLAGNFNATADDMLVLISDGTYWIELDRSAN